MVFLSHITRVFSNNTNIITCPEHKRLVLVRCLKNTAAEWFHNSFDGTASHEKIMSGLTSWFWTRANQSAASKALHASTIKSGETAIGYCNRLKALAKTLQGTTFEVTEDNLCSVIIQGLSGTNWGEFFDTFCYKNSQPPTTTKTCPTC